MELAELSTHEEIGGPGSSAPGRVRTERFGDSTDMCSLVNAQVGWLRRGLAASAPQSAVRRGRHADARDDGAGADPRARQGGRGPRGAHRFCMVTQGQGLSKRDFREDRGGRKGWSPRTRTSSGALSIGHMSARPARSGSPTPACSESITNVETGAHPHYPEVPRRRSATEGRIRTIDAVKGGGSRELRRRASSTSGSRRASAWRWPSSIAEIDPDPRCRSNLLNPQVRHQVRRPRADGPLGGRQVGGDLPAHHSRRPVSACAAGGSRNPRRPPAASPSRRGLKRRDDGELPDHRWGAEPADDREMFEGPRV